MFGHMVNGPDSGKLEQGPLPPAQFLNPLAMSFTPISITVGPVTIGGNTRLSTFGEQNDSPISRRAQRQEVPASYQYFANIFNIVIAGEHTEDGTVTCGAG